MKSNLNDCLVSYKSAYNILLESKISDSDSNSTQNPFLIMNPSDESLDELICKSNLSENHREYLKTFNFDGVLGAIYTVLGDSRQFQYNNYVFLSTNLHKLISNEITKFIILAAFLLLEFGNIPNDLILLFF